MGQELFNRFGVENRFHKKIIFHLSFLFPSPPGRGARGKGAEHRKAKIERYVLCSLSPHPDSLSQRERESEMINEKCQMTNGKWVVPHLAAVTDTDTGILRL